MNNLIQLVVSNYNEVMKTVEDPIVDTWPLTGSPGPMLGIAGVYLIFVLYIGPKMMRKRPAFELNTFMIIYNAFQVLFSIWLTNMVLNIDYKHIVSVHEYNIPLSSNSANVHAVQTSWWYFVAKIIELLDTVFFVLRKKQNQITFLHVYHHAIMIIAAWCYLKFLPGNHVGIAGFLNCVVHVIMYSYYFIAALGPKYEKYLWWKKYLTWIQLLQFGLVIVLLTLTLIMDCRTPKALTYFFVIIAITFLFLFSDFYYKTYKKKIM